MLTPEEQVELEDLTISDYWPILMKAIEQGVERQKDNFLSSSIETNDRQLLINKARLEGAQTLFLFINGMKKRKKK